MRSASSLRRADGLFCSCGTAPSVARPVGRTPVETSPGGSAGTARPQPSSRSVGYGRLRAGALEPAPASAARQARPGLAHAAADVTPRSPRRGLGVPSANAGL